MGKIVKCPAGQWTTLINNLASGMPAHWTLDLKTTAGGAVSGKARESRSFLPLGLAMSPSAETELSPSMSFHRYWTNASYRLEIYPDGDLEAHFR